MEKNTKKIVEETLKPCPFCGGKAKMHFFNKMYWADCTECEAQARGSTSFFEAVANWERRPE